MNAKHWLPGLTVCLALGAQAADTRLKPGLWEMTLHNGSAASVHMPKLTPEQQAQMAKMGIKLPTMSSDGGMIVKTCLTKEQVERDELPKPSDNAREKCQQTDTKRSGNTVSWTMVCTGDYPMSGNGTMTMSSAESFVSTVHMVGQGRTVDNKTEGKWLGSACGK